MRILIVVEPKEKAMTPLLKPYLNGAGASIYSQQIVTWAQVESICKANNLSAIATSSLDLLKKVAPAELTSVSLDNFQGSLFKKGGIEVLVLPPLKQIFSIPYGKFLIKRYLAKLVNPEEFPSSEGREFSYTLLNQYTEYPNPKDFVRVAIDTETFVHPQFGPLIYCFGFTALSKDGSFKSYSLLNPMKSEYDYAYMQQVCECPAEKIFQNGKYDLAYLMRVGIAPVNYLWDTLNLAHCIYSELPKDLAFITTLWARNTYNWKSLGNSEDLFVRAEYCGRDTWATYISFESILSNYPDYAKANYLIQFPLTFPCHLCEMTGIKRDLVKLAESQKVVKAKIQKSLDWLKSAIHANFNPNSSVQKLVLIKNLGLKTATNADEKTLKKCAYLHPLNAMLVERIIAVVKDRKLLSTYLTEESNFYGRVLSSINPTGTKTGRLASSKHHFWTGLQLQNIPGDVSVKGSLQSDSGFHFAEIDSEQAESRDTAYLSGCKNLISAVSGSEDFHSINASAFFGVSYSSIRNDETKEVLNKPLRNLAKRVNHGATYVMGPDIMVETMGWTYLDSTRKLLSLKASWSYRDITSYLLRKFHQRYPELEAVFYPAVVEEIRTTHKLTSPLVWTRYCFGDPNIKTNKHIYNSYVAHKPQSLNAERLNKAFMALFYSHMINPEKRKDIIFFGQIHDSIPFQYRIGKEYLVDEVKKAMEIPITVKGADNVTRTYTVPASSKFGSVYWADLK